jgi:cytochrome b561
MKQKSTSHYDSISQAFHWITAVLVSSAFILGPEHYDRLIEQGVDPAIRSDIVWHESLGVSVLILTVLRLAWVALRPATPQVPMARWMHVAGKLVHVTLWALLLALPVTALLALGSQTQPLTLLAGVRIDQMPMLAGAAIGTLVNWGDLHKLFGDGIMLLAGLHAGAAIYHHMVLKDGVLSMMLPHKSR